MPLITVVTPFKNEERYLREAIESVIGQTYNNWEFLLIDDGSTDKSTEIAKEYASQYPGKIRYLHHENHANRGVCASRNLGIESAGGDYIAFLDGDDFWLPEKLQKQVVLLNEYPEALMLCEATHYLNKGRNPKVENIDVPVGVPADQLYGPPLLIFRLYPLGPGDAPCMNAILIETGMIKTIGGFDESFVGSNSLYEDQAFLFKVYFHSSVYVSSICNNIYRQRPDSSMHKLLAAGKQRAGRKYFLKWVKTYLKHQYVQYPAVNAFYKKVALAYTHPRIYKYTYGIFFKFRNAVNKNKKYK